VYIQAFYTVARTYMYFINASVTS